MKITTRSKLMENNILSQRLWLNLLFGGQLILRCFSLTQNLSERKEHCLIRRPSTVRLDVSLCCCSRWNQPCDSRLRWMDHGCMDAWMDAVGAYSSDDWYAAPRGNYAWRHHWWRRSGNWSLLHHAWIDCLSVCPSVSLSVYEHVSPEQRLSIRQ